MWQMNIRLLTFPSTYMNHHPIYNFTARFNIHIVYIGHTFQIYSEKYARWGGGPHFAHTHAHTYFQTIKFLSQSPCEPLNYTTGRNCQYHSTASITTKTKIILHNVLGYMHIVPERAIIYQNYIISKSHA